MTSFPVPPEFEVPEGTKAGDTFEAMAELRLEPDGKLTLVSLEGCECGGEKEMEDDGEPEDDSATGKGFVNQVEIKFGSAGLD